MESKSSLQKELRSSADSSWMELFKKAVRLYQKGVGGDQNSTLEALTLWKEIRNQAPGNNLVTAYYGSTLCLLGRDQTDPLERSATVIRGLKLLDQAVNSEPDNFEIRVIRGSLCVNLPEMYFHRNNTAVEDSEYIIACYEKYPESLPADIYLQFLYNLSIAYGNLGETEASESVLKKLLQVTEEPKYRSSLPSQGTTNSPYGAVSFYILLQPLRVILAEGEKLHQRALTGGKAAVSAAIDFFAKAQVFHPKNQLLKAYHADCLSLQGKFATNTGEMFSSAIKAMKIIDTAVTRVGARIGDPESVQIRYLRANHSLRLPELFFARTATAITDLEYLRECIQKEPELFSPKQREEILYHLGLSYSRLGLHQEADEIWQSLYPKSSAGIREKIEIQRRNQSEPVVTSACARSGLSLEADSQEFYAQAKSLHDLGVAGNHAAAKKGLKMWEEAYAANPGDPVAEGFYGSSIALVGRDSGEINQMFGNGIKGLKHLNDALSRTPENWELRLLRAYLAYSLPEVFFHTTGQAIEDFLYLKKVWEESSQGGAPLFPKELYEKIQIDLQQARLRV